MAEVQPRTLRGALIRAHYLLKKEFDGTARDHGKTARKASEHAQPAHRIPRFSPPEPPSNPQHDWGIVHISRHGTWDTALDRHTDSRIAPASTKEENGIAQEPDSIDHFALGVGPSLDVAPSVGLLLNYAPWGIRLTPIVISLTILRVRLAMTVRQSARAGRFSCASHSRNAAHFDQAILIRFCVWLLSAWASLCTGLT
jgi:hypothetical protein